MSVSVVSYYQLKCDKKTGENVIGGLLLNTLSNH
jgi:hypothetical protein